MNKLEKQKKWPPRNLQEIRRRIIGCVREVNAALGPGLDKQAYENALARAFYGEKLMAAHDYPLRIIVDDAVLGEFRADFIVEGTILVELEAAPRLTREHVARAESHLRTEGLELCLLINFGKPKVEIKRLLPSVR
jgi:GxxExxY protein